MNDEVLVLQSAVHWPPSNSLSLPQSLAGDTPAICWRWQPLLPGYCSRDKLRVSPLNNCCVWRKEKKMTVFPFQLFGGTSYLWVWQSSWVFGMLLCFMPLLLSFFCSQHCTSWQTPKWIWMQMPRTILRRCHLVLFDTTLYILDVLVKSSSIQWKLIAPLK